MRHNDGLRADNQLYVDGCYRGNSNLCREVIILAKIIELPTSPPRKATDEAIRQAMRPRRRWNWRRAAGNLRGLLTGDNLRTVIGITAAGMFFGYLALSYLAGEPW